MSESFGVFLTTQRAKESETTSMCVCHFNTRSMHTTTEHKRATKAFDSFVLFDYHSEIALTPGLYIMKVSLRQIPSLRSQLKSVKIVPQSHSIIGAQPISKYLCQQRT